MNEGVYPFGGGMNSPLTQLGTVYRLELNSDGMFDTGQGGIPQHGDILEIEGFLRSNATTGSITKNTYTLFNGDFTATNYYYHRYSQGSAASGAAGANTPYPAETPGGTDVAGSYTHIRMRVFAYNSRMGLKIAQVQTSLCYNVTSRFETFGMQQWLKTEPITRVIVQTVDHPSSLFMAGSRVVMRVY